MRSAQNNTRRSIRVSYPGLYYLWFKSERNGVTLESMSCAIPCSVIMQLPQFLTRHCSRIKIFYSGLVYSYLGLYPRPYDSCSRAGHFACECHPLCMRLISTTLHHKPSVATIYVTLYPLPSCCKAWLNNFREKAINLCKLILFCYATET